MQKIFLKYGFAWVVLSLLIQGFTLKAQSQREHVTLQYSFTKSETIQGEQFKSICRVEPGLLNSNLLPVFQQMFPISGDNNVKVTIENAVYSQVAPAMIQRAATVNRESKLEYTVVMERKQPRVLVTINALRQSGSGIEKLEQFDLVISSSPGIRFQSLGKKANATRSVLTDGAWYKVYVNQTGVQRITIPMLKNMGIDPASVDPRTIKIYGNGPGTLPFSNTAPRIDDLWENPIEVGGESDGKLDVGDAIYFYGKSQSDVWGYDAGSGRFIHQNNWYSDATVYFITFGGAVGKRIATLPSPASNQNNDGHYDHLVVHEKDAINLIRSGRRWFGEEFSRELTQTISLNIGNSDAAFPAFIRSNVVAHSVNVSSTFDVWMNGTYLFNQLVPPCSADFTNIYAGEHTGTSTMNLPSGSVDIKYTFNQAVPGALGWLDYIEIQSRNYLTLPSGQLLFRDKNSIGAGKVTGFSIPSGVTARIWDVTRPFEPFAIQSTYGSGSVSFSMTTDSLREMLVFDGSTYQTPEFGGNIANQNLHGLPQADMIIVTYEDFVMDANRLATVRRSQGLSVNVVTIGQVYNEFSSGMQDITAVRDMMRMFYKRSTGATDMPKYLLLFGRASYDYKSRMNNNTNLVPTFESWNSFEPVGSYCSDDYFGLLDDNEGQMNPTEVLDISIGRIPATTPESATIMTNKIINYANAQDYGDWKNRLVFIADDEDGNLHESQSNSHADNARNKYKNYNVQKIFIDAFKEATTAGGARNPDAQSEIVRSVERGAMLINYTGHGGEVGWAAERILNTDDIQGWTNAKKLPLFFTATCEFSRFDDPARISAGEYVFLNPNGGGIGLFTTVRLVDAGNNNSLNYAFLKYAGFDSTAAYNRLRLGDIMRLTKNEVLNDNTRNFTLLADPSMMLAYPDYRVTTTSINNTPVSLSTDTLKAFSLVNISGSVTDLNGNKIPTFNGVVYPTVFDKVSNYTTVVNNPEYSSSFNFQMQNNVIYRGSATVTGGDFTFSFIVPKDIGYQIGNGRISYYAANGNKDAHGYDQRILVGGTANFSGNDDSGPEIKLYLNDEKFAFGGLTNDKPVFIAKLKDATGINITGVGIGRELGLTLNNDNTTTTSMNDFYRARTDSYQEGEVRYQMKGLPLGKNSLKFGAWDVHNNYSESVLEFVVAGSAEMALQHVLNYPNPFTTNTTFHFDHNKPGQDLKVMIQIFTVSGKLIKTLQTETNTAGSHFDQLTWDGKDEYGDAIGKGVYVYKVKVKSGTGKTAEEFQKLVILN